MSHGLCKALSKRETMHGQHLDLILIAKQDPPDSSLSCAGAAAIFDFFIWAYVSEILGATSY